MAKKDKASSLSSMIGKITAGRRKHRLHDDVEDIDLTDDVLSANSEADVSPKKKGLFGRFGSKKDVQNYHPPGLRSEDRRGWEEC